MRFFSLLLILSVAYVSYSQEKKIDQLEILYSQNHYTKVIRKANKLLAIPDYDYSGLPYFYKSISIFKLISDEAWSKKHKNALNEAITNYNKFLEHDKAIIYTKSHYFEIAELKLYLINLSKHFRQFKKKGIAHQIESFTETQLKQINQYGIKHFENKKENNGNEKSNNLATRDNSKLRLSLREKIIAYAKQFIGVKYKWAGTSPKGFDCSGYIGFVFKKYGIIVPRSAAAQKNSSKKLKLLNALMGDLLFFKSSGKITHVGLVVSKANDALTMIHASTSKGIIITNIEKSSYWKPKLASAGRIIL